MTNRKPITASLHQLDHPLSPGLPLMWPTYLEKLGSPSLSIKLLEYRVFLLHNSRGTNTIASLQTAEMRNGRHKILLSAQGQARSELCKASSNLATFHAWSLQPRKAAHWCISMARIPTCHSSQLKIPESDEALSGLFRAREVLSDSELSVPQGRTS